MDPSRLLSLPDELLEAVVFHLPPAETVAFGSSCTRIHKIASEHLVWRRHCLQGWRYWDPRHDIDDLQQQPPAQVRWRQLFNDRKQLDKKTLDDFEALLATQQLRLDRCERISANGYDIKDLLQHLRDDTPDDAEDVLARRYYAGVVLDQVHRRVGLEKWDRLQRHQMVRLEEVLGAYDLFVVGRQRGDLHDIDEEFGRLAENIRSGDDQFDERSTRHKAVEIARYLRNSDLVGNPSEDEYHALRNNFLSMALFDDLHSSLPLQSVAIYCAVARRLGVNARPSNYPHHVHAVIEAPAGLTLNGQKRVSDPNTEGFDPEFMHMDPWRSSEEVPRDQLTTRLAQMGAPPGQHAAYLGPASTLELALRTGRNIMNSVQEARNRQRGTNKKPTHPDIEAAWYSMLWSMMVLGDANSANTAATLHRRRQCLPYLAEHFQAHFPEDLGLVESLVTPMFSDEREHHILIHLITTLRAGDRNAKAPSPRDSTLQTSVRFRIGQSFQHKRYGYEGFIVGWDAHCSADDRWISQMRVDDLSRGRDQPFYNIIAEDKSVRYVAEENIHPLTIPPCESLMCMAGRYFKRWDEEKCVFVSNIRDEYPDD